MLRRLPKPLQAVRAGPDPDRGAGARRRPSLAWPTWRKPRDGPSLAPICDVVRVSAGVAVAAPGQARESGW